MPPVPRTTVNGIFNIVQVFRVMYFQIGTSVPDINVPPLSGWRAIAAAILVVGLIIKPDGMPAKDTIVL